MKMSSASIASAIRRQISGGTLAYNDRLPPERELASRFDVARGTIRSALRLLESERYLDIRPGSGAYVVYDSQNAFHPNIQNARPLELIDARFALEPHICRLSVLHGQRAEFQRLETLCYAMEGCGDDPMTFAEADTEFHRLLAETTGNGLLIWIISQINLVRAQPEWRRMRALTLNSNIIQRYNLQHRRILEAIVQREPELAANAMKEHLETARLSLTRAADT